MSRFRRVLVSTCVLILAMLFGTSQLRGTDVAVFFAVEFVLAPMTLLGVGLVIGSGAQHVRQTGMSMTAIGPLLNRYILHEVGLRRDEGAKAIFEGSPSVAVTASTGPTIWAAMFSGMSAERLGRLVGYPPNLQQTAKIAAFLTSASIRTYVIDTALTEHLPSMDQLVILGAGFDTKGFRHAPRKTLRVFEVDTNRTQPMKKRMLAASPLDTSDVTFVTVDFNVDDWLERLVASGFDTAKKSFFIWEGVTYYLPPVVVSDTLSKVARCAPGSLVALDFFSRDVVAGRDFAILPKLLALAGEPLLFGVDMSHPVNSSLRHWMENAGLRLERAVPTRKDEPGLTQLAGTLLAAVP